MSKLDSLIERYQQRIALPWSDEAAAQRVVFCVYDEGEERRLRARLDEFELVTKGSDHDWALFDLTETFANWMASQKYAKGYFNRPELLNTLLPKYLEWLAGQFEGFISNRNVDSNTVVALSGVGSIFGFMTVKDLVDKLAPRVKGRLLVLLPGSYENNNYHLLGGYDGWPENLSELKVLDPSCGSGHFLVAVFLMLVPMRMAAENLSAEQAVDNVLSENIHGLELDQRCVELAAFALALTAWRYPDSNGEPLGYRPLPELHLACSGQGINSSKKDWLALAEGNTEREHGLEQLYNLFKDAPTLGSLINPHRVLGKDLVTAEWAELQPVLQTLLKSETSDEQHELGIVAQGIAKAAELLAGKYHLVATNVPYLARGKHSQLLRDFCDIHHPLSKGDLATAFQERCLAFLDTSCSTALVLPQNWLFSMSYTKYRKELLSTSEWQMLVRLGAGAFETISGEVVKAVLWLGSNRAYSNNKTFSAIDVSQVGSAINKGQNLPKAGFITLDQNVQQKNPDARILLALKKGDSSFLLEYANSFLGLGTGDFCCYGRCYWEMPVISDKWTWLQCAPEETKYHAGLEHVVAWDFPSQRVRGMSKAHRDRIHNQDQSGQKAWGTRGIAMSLVGDFRASVFTGEKFEKSIAILRPKKPEYTEAIWCYYKYGDFVSEVRELDQNVIVANGTLVKVPFNLHHWQKIAAEKYPNGLPKPYSNDPTQWIFHGHPAKSDNPLQVAITRLLGYRWPAELDEEMELSDEARVLVKECDKLNKLVDRDGIVCIPALGGESRAEDRVVNMLAAAYGDEWSGKLNQLLADAGHSGKSLESWLRDKFFTEHCKLFGNRPFIWHIWDGLRDGFSVLVNYHTFDYKKLERLIHNYLRDWIKRQSDDKKAGIDGAEERMAAAEALRIRLEKILDGEDPYDIFVRWKPIEQQPIGWNPDLNDGVRLNIRPFVQVEDIKTKDAGVLRAKPGTIKWNNDRGKDVASAPWFHEFDGVRVNDHHLTLAEKRKAREAAGETNA